MQTKLAVVILNWNGSAMMRRFLPSVVSCSQLPGVQVIVADNHSSDDSLEMLHTCFPTVRTIVLVHHCKKFYLQLVCNRWKA